MRLNEVGETDSSSSSQLLEMTNIGYARVKEVPKTKRVQNITVCRQRSAISKLRMTERSNAVST
jgi:hypothetical protein